MKKLFIASSLVLGLSIVSYAAFADDVPSASTVGMEKILSNLQAAGCTIIKEVEYDDGVYKAEGVCNNQYAKVHLDAKTGEMSTSITSERHMSMMDAVKAVEAAGYTNVYKVEMRHHDYEVDAIEASTNKKVDLYVDAETGKIGKDLF